MAFWDRVRLTKAQTPLNELPLPSNMSPIRLEECPTVFLGEGWFVGITNRRYRLEGGNRQFDGPEGEYVESVSFFFSGRDATEYFFLPVDKYPFENTESPGWLDEVVDGTHLGESWGTVTERLKRLSGAGIYYAEWEVRRLVQGMTRVVFQTVHYGPFQLHFYGRGKAARLRAFEYTFPEEPLSL